jgi:23S rRNA (adenine2503-C2)-methyltransferase
MPENQEKPEFFGLLPADFDKLASQWGWPAFRGKQVRDWVYRKDVTDPAKMTNLGKRDREILAGGVAFVNSIVTAHQTSSDGTQKLLLTWPSGANAETVMIPDADRRTACVSSQVGCPVGCTFCASGIGGVKGNLSAGQIVEQVLRLNWMLRGVEVSECGGVGVKEITGTGTVIFSPTPRHPHTSTPSSSEHVTNVVFMGMGEPLANYANVMAAIRILHDPQCLNMGARRITISTVGVPPKMRELAKEELPINLAISLHAPNEKLRKQLIPWAEHFSLDDILGAARFYFEKTGREITLEYILLSGVNDRPEHARQLSQIVKTLRANVNLIRYNEVETLPYKRPKSEDVVVFQDVLRHNGVNAHVRKSRGRDIDAACGQLRKKREGSAVVQISVPS